MDFSLDSLSGDFKSLSVIFTFILAVVPAIYIMIQYITKNSFKLMFEDEHQKFVTGIFQSGLSIFFLTVSGLAGIFLTIQVTIDFTNKSIFWLDLIFLLGFLVGGILLIIYLLILKFSEKRFPKFFQFIFIWNFYSFWYIYGGSLYNIPEHKKQNAIEYLNLGVILFTIFFTLLYFIYLQYHLKKSTKRVYYKIKQLDYNVLKRNDVFRVYTMKDIRIILTTKSELQKKERKLYYVYELGTNISFEYTMEEI